MYKDGQLVTSTLTDINANFNFNIKNISSGIYIFTIFAKDTLGNQSAVYSLPIIIGERVNVDVKNIFLSPTISIQKNNIIEGENLVILGYSIPNSKVAIYLQSEIGSIFSYEVNTDYLGRYQYTLDSLGFELGNYKITAKTLFNGLESFESITLSINILSSTKEEIDESNIFDCSTIFADLNCDQKVNLIDFSIMAYWYNNEAPPALIDLNKDGKINLSDFSILAFNWTG